MLKVFFNPAKHIRKAEKNLEDQIKHKTNIKETTRNNKKQNKK